MLLDVPAAVAPDDALIALRDYCDLHDCDVELELLGDSPGPYAYAIRVRRRTTRRTVVCGDAARVGELGRVVSGLLWKVTP